MTSTLTSREPSSSTPNFTAASAEAQTRSMDQEHPNSTKAAQENSTPVDSSVTKQETAKSNDNRRRGTDCATKFSHSATLPTEGYGGDDYPSYDTLQADITAEFYEYQSQPGYTWDKHLLWEDSLFTENFGYSNPWNCTCTSATTLPCKVYKNGSGAGN
ncbi:hypothetical protein V490_00336 [Pseudogymnoascus sp. VKM F-3557]|nr:hypothetical protein V490_00336 [Pseudogymnoascus sp. VKM F-3557]